MNKKENKDSVFVSVRMPFKWKRQLEAMAETRSKIMGFRVRSQDFIRHAIQKRYDLKGECRHGVKVETIFFRSMQSETVDIKKEENPDAR